MNEQDLLWQRVAALRGIDLPKRGDQASITGDRFEVLLSGDRSAEAPDLERARQLAREPGCRGVVGEIVVVTTRLRRGTPARKRAPLGWRQGLIEREGARLAVMQPTRRSGPA